MNEMTMDELVNEAARIIMVVREENKEKDVQIEMGWVGAKTKGIHQVLFRSYEIVIICL
jgi:20S proteasome subunit alpha 7